MHVKLTIIHNGTEYTTKGDAQLITIPSLAASHTHDFLKVIFTDPSIKNLIDQQKSFICCGDECIFETTDRVFNGIYKAHSRMDGSPIIYLNDYLDYLKRSSEENK